MAGADLDCISACLNFYSCVSSLARDFGKGAETEKLVLSIENAEAMSHSGNWFCHYGTRPLSLEFAISSASLELSEGDAANFVSMVRAGQMIGLTPNDEAQVAEGIGCAPLPPFMNGRFGASLSVLGSRAPSGGFLHFHLWPDCGSGRPSYRAPVIGTVPFRKIQVGTPETAAEAQNFLQVLDQFLRVEISGRIRIGDAPCP